jgi:hypothetical protein
VAQNSLTWDFIGKDNVSKVAGSVGQGLSKMGAITAVALGGLAKDGIEAFAGALKAGFDEAVAYQAQGRITAQVLKSTGDASRMSVAGVQELAGNLESMSGVDEMLINNGENILLTFTNVRNEIGKGNDVFTRATGLALDMSVALGQDLKSSNIQLGKALNDPIKGLTALSRVGVTFNAQQKAQITTLMKNHDLLGAQKIILGELSKEFGGAAKAAGSGFGGAIARVKDVVSDTFRNLEIKALPTLTTMADRFATALPGALQKAQDAFGRLWTAIGPTVISIGQKIPGALNAAETAASAFLAGFQGGNLSGASADMQKVATVGGLVKTAFNDLVSAGKAVLSFYEDHTTGVNRTAIAGLALYATIKTVVTGYQAYKAVTATIAAIELGIAAAKQAVALATYGESSSVVLNSAAWVAQKVVVLASSAATKAAALATGVSTVVTNLAVNAQWQLMLSTQSGIIAKGKDLAIMGAQKVATLASAAASAVWTGAQWLLNAALTANPIGLVIVGIVALVAAIVLAYKNSATFRTIVQAAMAGVKVAFDVVVFSVRNNLVPVFQWLVNMWLNIAGKILDAATWAFGWIPGLGPKLREAQAGFRSFQTAVNGVLQGLRDKTVTVSFKTIGLNTVLAPGTKMSTIYHFAKGGVVPGPIGKELMAAVHGGELVLNGGQQAAVAAMMASAGSGSAPPTVLVSVTLDGKELTSTVKTEIANQVRKAKGSGR